MPDYIYTFGYETPRQRRNNNDFRFNDEDSESVIIEATDETSAIAWGNTISKEFIKLLYNDEKEIWDESGFANWTESVTLETSHLQRVQVGKLPDFTNWLSKYKNER